MTHHGNFKKLYHSSGDITDKLNNNYKHDIRLHNKKYPTVNKYIYSQLLHNPLFKKELIVSNEHDIVRLFKELYERERDDTITRSLDISLQSIFKDKDMMDLLLSTNNSDIKYMNNDPFLGVGLTNDGENMYGKYLKHIRHTLRTHIRTNEEENKNIKEQNNIYNVYLAEKGLLNAIQNGDDLTKCIGKTPIEIIDELGRVDIERNSINRNNIFELVHSKMLPSDTLNFITYPETLVHVIRKKKIRELRTYKLKQRKGIVFDMFADYTIQKYYPDLDADLYDTAKKQQFHTMGEQQKTQLENKLFRLYESDMLSSRLTKNINEVLSGFTIPSEEEVEMVEHTPILYNDINTITELSYISEEGEDVFIYPFDFPEDMKKYKQLSPLHETLFKVDNVFFPTVIHYVIFKLLETVTTTPYTYLLTDTHIPVVDNVNQFVSICTLSAVYKRLHEDVYIQRVDDHMKSILDIKFKDPIMKDILSRTGDAYLIWDDPNDTVLGTTDDHTKAYSRVGAYLMELRTHYHSYKKNVLDTLNTRQLDYIFNKDPFTRKWIHMRLRDTCHIIHMIKTYTEHKQNVPILLTPEFVTRVLDNIYQPCSNLHELASTVRVPTPCYFNDIIQSCGITQQNVISVIWNRFYVIIYYMLTFMKDTHLNDNVKTAIAISEKLVSSDIHHLERIIDDDMENDILHAITNILYGLSVFNTLFTGQYSISKIDIITATSIILNVDITSELSNLVVSESETNDETNDIESYIFPRDIYESNHSFDDNVETVSYFLNEQLDIENVHDITNWIMCVIRIISTFDIPENIKKNRIRFFARQR